MLLIGYGVSILWWPGGHGRVYGLQRLPMLEYISFGTVFVKDYETGSRWQLHAFA